MKLRGNYTSTSFTLIREMGYSELQLCEALSFVFEMSDGYWCWEMGLHFGSLFRILARRAMKYYAIEPPVVLAAVLSEMDVPIISSEELAEVMMVQSPTCIVGVAIAMLQGNTTHRTLRGGHDEFLDLPAV